MTTQNVRLQAAIVVWAMATWPSVGGTPVSYTCRIDDIHQTTETWYRDGELLTQMPAGSEKIPALAEMRIISETDAEIRAKWVHEIAEGVTYFWIVELPTGDHRQATTDENGRTTTVSGKCEISVD